MTHLVTSSYLKLSYLEPDPEEDIPHFARLEKLVRDRQDQSFGSYFLFPHLVVSDRSKVPERETLDCPTELNISFHIHSTLTGLLRLRDLLCPEPSGRS